ncbi:hypothetical protein [Paenibacillus sp. B01]|uniref:hypothetical protein n=1 Tax=Paenibacillus sp. B01 TaxID=2660554 RepID=UPI00129B470B|nr:hypothetical protein [Paenibacillus sp. B01]QGG57363.1 hypothetical protein GE073_18360 [Paenibacillus sp. B01]
MRSGSAPQPHQAGRRRRAGLLPVLAVLASLLVGTAAYAHLTGAFAEYLAVVYDESTTDKLREDLETARREIAKLEPELDARRKTFLENRDAAVPKLLFYQDRGLDLSLELLRGAGSVTDLLGSRWLLQRQIELELDRLDELYRSYLQVGLTRQSLQSRQELLAMIESNLALRQPFLDSVGELGLEEIANYLDIDWVSEVEEPLKAALLADAGTVAESWREWLAESPLDGSLELAAGWLNERSGLSYYFRADHLYAVYEQEGANVILIGQLLQNERGDAQLMLEAGFYNGFAVPDKALEELKGFELPYAELRRLPGAGEQAYLQQAEGRIVVVAKND